MTQKGFLCRHLCFAQSNLCVQKDKEERKDGKTRERKESKEEERECQERSTVCHVDSSSMW